jgi:hypothetical protein
MRQLPKKASTTEKARNSKGIQGDENMSFRECPDHRTGTVRAGDVEDTEL